MGWGAAVLVSRSQEEARFDFGHTLVCTKAPVADCTEEAVVAGQKMEKIGPRHCYKHKVCIPSNWILL